MDKCDLRLSMTVSEPVLRSGAGRGTSGAAWTPGSPTHAGPTGAVLAKSPFGQAQPENPRRCRLRGWAKCLQRFKDTNVDSRTGTWCSAGQQRGDLDRRAVDPRVGVLHGLPVAGVGHLLQVQHRRSGRDFEGFRDVLAGGLGAEGPPGPPRPAGRRTPPARRTANSARNRRFRCQGRRSARTQLARWASGPCAPRKTRTSFSLGVPGGAPRRACTVICRPSNRAPITWASSAYPCGKSSDSECSRCAIRGSSTPAVTNVLRPPV